MLIVVFTFFADWFQVPQLSASGAGQYLSPNGDGNADTFTISYHINDNFKISVHVLSGQKLVRSLADDQAQPSGDHFITWDGRSSQGATLPDGLYTIEITARGSLRSATQGI